MIFSLIFHRVIVVSPISRAFMSFFAPYFYISLSFHHAHISLSPALALQVEYALKAIDHAGAVVGILTKHGIVLGAERKVPNLLISFPIITPLFQPFFLWLQSISGKLDIFLTTGQVCEARIENNRCLLITLQVTSKLLENVVSDKMALIDNHIAVCVAGMRNN